MNRLRRWYNKNRKIFWLTVFIAIVVINLPRVLNEYAKDKKKVSSSISNNTTTYANESYSVISEEHVEEKTNEENTEIINNFVEYCNNGNVEEAYQLLSNNCKQKLYPTVNDFAEKYYNRNFKTRRIYNLQAWISNEDNYTYKIDLKEDMLATGNANSASKEDYYTIVYEDGEVKLNINRYIGNVEFNNSNESDNIKIEVLSKDIFMDYEIYNIKVTSKIRKVHISR